MFRFATLSCRAPCTRSLVSGNEQEVDGDWQKHEDA